MSHNGVEPIVDLVGRPKPCGQSRTQSAYVTGKGEDCLAGNDTRHVAEKEARMEKLMQNLEEGKPLR